MRDLRKAASRLGDAWDRFWFRPFEPEAARLYRAVLGAFSLMVLVLLYASWGRYYAVDGVSSFIDGPRTSAGSVKRLFCAFTWFGGAVPLRAYWWGGVLAATGLALGLKTRLCAAALFILFSAMEFRNPLLLSGEEHLLRMTLLYAFLWGGDAASSGWPLRLAQVQTAMVYAITAAYKLADETWRGGDAIYWVLASPQSNWPWPQALAEGPWSGVLTYGVLLLEASFPVLVCGRRTRGWAVLAMGLAHLSMAAFIPSISVFALAWLCPLVLFLPPHWTRRLAGGGWSRRYRSA